MCKFCDLELNKRMVAISESLAFKNWPKEVKDYFEWMYTMWDEGWKWRIDSNSNVFLKMFNEGGYNFTELECKFCPKCGNKLEETIKEVK